MATSRWLSPPLPPPPPPLVGLYGGPAAPCRAMLLLLSGVLEAAAGAWSFGRAPNALSPAPLTDLSLGCDTIDRSDGRPPLIGADGNGSRVLLARPSCIGAAIRCNGSGTYLLFSFCGRNPWEQSHVCTYLLVGTFFLVFSYSVLIALLPFTNADTGYDEKHNSATFWALVISLSIDGASGERLKGRLHRTTKIELCGLHFRRADSSREHITSHLQKLLKSVFA